MDKRVDYLIRLIESQGYSVKSFALKIGIPYSTLRSMFQKDLGGASVNNVMKICKALGITVEEMYAYSENPNGTVRDSDSKEPYIPETMAAHMEGDELTEADYRDMQRILKIVEKRLKS